MNAKKSREEKNCVFARSLGFGDNKQQMCTSFAAATCVSMSRWHFILFLRFRRLALHAIKCVDYKVVAIDLILMLVCALHSFALSRVFVLMSITLQTGHFTNCLFQKRKMLKFHMGYTQPAVHCRFSSFNRLLLLLLILCAAAVVVAANVGIVATANSTSVTHTAHTVFAIQFITSL